MLDSIVQARGGSGAPTAADSAAFRAYIPELIAPPDGRGAKALRVWGPTQCHDITVYPAIGLAGGGLRGVRDSLLGHSGSHQPRRLSAVADSNFAYWHSATFSNDGSKIMFTDEWGGGGGPKCRESDPEEWGANAIFTIDGTDMEFPELLQAPGASDFPRELRRPQRVPDPHPRVVTS